MIDPSSLTKFRKLRLKDINLLDMLIGKTVTLAIEKEILKSNSIIVDATHSKARYNQKSPRDVLQDRARKLRKAVYSMDESVNVRMPAKNTSDKLEEKISYCQKLITFIEKESGVALVPKIMKPLNLLKETVENDVEQLRLAADPDARVGHKSADSAFFGYKTHLAMTEERIITAVVITTGEKNDGKQLETLVEKSKAAGMQVKTVIGDIAFPKRIIFRTRKEMISDLYPSLTLTSRRAPERRKRSSFSTKMHVCTYANRVIWRFERHARVKRIAAKTREIPTILTLKHASIVR